MKFFVLSIFLFLSTAYAEPQNDFYKERYGLKNPFEKLINNHGDGFEPLYGVRNFRVVLHGVLYRSGANNKWNKYDPKPNNSPMPVMGLENLCREGFSKSIYLYQKDYKDSPREMRCQSILGLENRMPYEQRSALSDPAILNDILNSVYEVAMDGSMGPVLAHCWNGWHASGYVAAISLRQFCGWSGKDAVKYWDANTDGHNDEPQYESIRKRIHGFKRIKALKLPKSVSVNICPAKG